MFYDCPNCSNEIEVETEELPENALDSIDYKCPECSQKVSIGWEPEIDIRKIY
jgi:DNA-directed RNA polymerase subunit RPC12/RpoP